MQRTDGANKDTDAYGAGKHAFKTSAPFTALTPTLMNAVQEEIARAIEAFGVVLNSGSFVQLSTILTTLLSAAGGSSTLQASASTPVLGTPNDANDHPSSGSNVWKLILRMPLNDGTYARLYAGDGSSAGDWALTANAVWDPASAAQTWSKDNTGRESNILWALNGEIRWYGRASGAGSWNNAGWSTNRGTFKAGGALTAISLGVQGTSTIIDASGGEMRVNGELDVTGPLFADDVNATNDVLAGSEFLYSSPPTRTKALAVGKGLISTTNAAAPVTFFDSNGDLEIQDAVRVVYPVDAPAGATLSTVRVLLQGVLSTPSYDVTLRRRHTVNFGAPARSYQNVDSATGSVASGVLGAVAGLSFGGLTVASNESYEIVITNTNGSSALLAIAAIEYDFTDPGPRNH